MRRLKIGVLGAGHLGKIHIKCLKELPDHYELVGFYDPAEDVATAVAHQFGIEAFPDAEALIDACEVIDIVTPTTTHYALACQCLEAGKHIFIEKPLAQSLDEGRALVELARRTGLKVQVGHVERFNPAMLALGDIPLDPMFVEAHRLAMFNPRGTDVSVVHDLMIHDVDLVLHYVRAPVVEVRASGVAVVSRNHDIANARIEFENGCVANLTASRISLKQMRKVRFFQRDAYISVDMLEKQAQVVRLFDQPVPATQAFELPTAEGTRYITVDMPQIEPVNAIRLELELFAQSIAADRTPPVPIQDGLRAMEVVDMIDRAIAAAQDRVLRRLTDKPHSG